MKTLLLLLCVSLSLTGCMTFQTNTRKDSIPKFSRILIVSRLPISTQVVLNNLVQAFPAQYEFCVVNAGKLALANPDSLIQQKIRQCHSEVMLTIEPQRDYLVTASFLGFSKAISETSLTMTNLADGRPFWKGIMESPGRSYQLSGRRIVERLKENGILSGRLRSQNTQ